MENLFAKTDFAGVANILGLPISATKDKHRILICYGLHKIIVISLINEGIDINS